MQTPSTYGQRVKLAFYDSKLRSAWLAGGNRREKRAAQRAGALREKGRTSYPRNRGRGKNRS